MPKSAIQEAGKPRCGGSACSKVTAEKMKKGYKKKGATGNGGAIEKANDKKSKSRRNAPRAQSSETTKRKPFNSENISTRNDNTAYCYFFQPKKGKEAEYTFYPSQQTKDKYDAENDDVGFFLRSNEVLSFVAVGDSTKDKYGGTSYPVALGRIVIFPGDWEQIETPGKLDVHNEDNVLHEYLSD